jgi:hypothetical protein
LNAILFFKSRLRFSADPNNVPGAKIFAFNHAHMGRCVRCVPADGGSTPYVRHDQAVPEFVPSPGQGDIACKKYPCFYYTHTL